MTLDPYHLVLKMGLRLAYVLQTPQSAVSKCVYVEQLSFRQFTEVEKVCKMLASEPFIKT